MFIIYCYFGVAAKVCHLHSILFVHLDDELVALVDEINELVEEKTLVDALLVALDSIVQRHQLAQLVAQHFIAFLQTLLVLPF